MIGDFMPTFFEKKQLVTPGEMLAEGDYLPGENTYVEAGKIYASRIGLVDSDNKKVNVVALRAFYVPTMIPRIIGRKGSMISMVKQETNCQIILGLNGVILVTGKTLEEEELAIFVIRKIEEESHTSGLTDRITELLKEKKIGKVEENKVE